MLRLLNQMNSRTPPRASEKSSPGRECTITPRPDGEQCEEDDCDTTQLLGLVEPDHLDESRVLCPTHRVLWLREVADQ